MALAADPRGLKRICPSCGLRYYDMNKRPVLCPGCSTEFTAETKSKTRRARVIANDEPVAVVEEEVVEKVAADGDTEIVSLDEVEDLEEADAEELDDEAGPDLELDESIEDLEDDEDDEDEDEEEDDED